MLACSRTSARMQTAHATRLALLSQGATRVVLIPQFNSQRSKAGSPKKKAHRGCAWWAFLTRYSPGGAFEPKLKAKSGHRAQPRTTSGCATPRAMQQLFSVHDAFHDQPKLLSTDFQCAPRPHAHLGMAVRGEQAPQVAGADLDELIRRVECVCVHCSIILIG